MIVHLEADVGGRRDCPTCGRIYPRHPRPSAQVDRADSARRRRREELQRRLDEHWRTTIGDTAA